MIKILITTILLTASFTPAFAAFSSNIVVLEKADMQKLNDEKIMDEYLNVLVEIEAIRTFHATSGFSVKQYDEFRELLKYRLRLLVEIHTRNLEIPTQLEHM